MGCANSHDASKDVYDHTTGSCWKEEGVTRTLTSFNYNETEIDITHFIMGHEALGLGGFGIVRHVKKLSGKDKGTEYAMKSMSKDAIIRRSSGPSAVSTELKCLILLSKCKYVCQLHYAFQSASHLFMVLELAKGGDLRHCLRATAKSRFSEEAAKQLICQIFLGLECCHKASILHRDVKPENILVTDAGIVKLSDFGVAKILPDVEDCRSTSGTHGYMAPEVYMGNHAHGTASEWFAAGITLHELLTGRRPFEAARLQAFRYSKPMSLSLSMPHALSPQLHPAAAAAAEGDCRAYRVQPAAGDGSPPMCSSNHHHDQQKVQPQGQQEKRDQLWPEHLYQHCDYLTPDCKDFVRALLIPDPRYRLGGSHCAVTSNSASSSSSSSSSSNSSSRAGLAAIKAHPWLRGFDWAALHRAHRQLQQHQQQQHDKQQQSMWTAEFPTAAALSLLCLQDVHANNREGAGLQPQLMEKRAGGGAGAWIDQHQQAANKEELRRALQLHLQAPPVSESHQALFCNYEYRVEVNASLCSSFHSSSSHSSHSSTGSAGSAGSVRATANQEEDDSVHPLAHRLTKGQYRNRFKSSQQPKQPCTATAGAAPFDIFSPHSSPLQSSTRKRASVPASST